jgi:hypothetical protein
LHAQPRAIVFHVKQDKNGGGREHCHVVWSRIDVEKEKARHVAFDHEKLMMVTREFARDHGLELPEGYSKELARGRRGRGYQMSLYDKRQEELGGLSLAERKAQVTALSQCSRFLTALGARPARIHPLTLAFSPRETRLGKARRGGARVSRMRARRGPAAKHGTGARPRAEVRRETSGPGLPLTWPVGDF